MEGTRARKGIDDQKANSLHVAYKITPIYQASPFHKDAVVSVKALELWAVKTQKWCTYNYIYTKV